CRRCRPAGRCSSRRRPPGRAGSTPARGPAGRPHATPRPPGPGWTRGTRRRLSSRARRRTAGWPACRGRRPAAPARAGDQGAHGSHAPQRRDYRAPCGFARSIRIADASPRPVRTVIEISPVAYPCRSWAYTRHFTPAAEGAGMSGARQMTFTLAFAVVLSAVGPGVAGYVSARLEGVKETERRLQVLEAELAAYRERAVVPASAACERDEP